jgi:hypothetical protein
MIPGQLLVNVYADEDANVGDFFQMWAECEIAGSAEIANERIKPFNVGIVSEDASKLLQQRIFAFVGKETCGHSAPQQETHSPMPRSVAETPPRFNLFETGRRCLELSVTPAARTLLPALELSRRLSWRKLSGVGRLAVAGAPRFERRAKSSVTPMSRL